MHWHSVSRCAVGLPSVCRRFGRALKQKANHQWWDCPQLSAQTLNDVNERSIHWMHSTHSTQLMLSRRHWKPREQREECRLRGINAVMSRCTRNCYVVYVDQSRSEAIRAINTRQNTTLCSALTRVRFGRRLGCSWRRDSCCALIVANINCFVLTSVTDWPLMLITKPWKSRPIALIALIISSEGFKCFLKCFLRSADLLRVCICPSTRVSVSCLALISDQMVCVSDSPCLRWEANKTQINR